MIRLLVALVAFTALVHSSELPRCPRPTVWQKPEREAETEPFRFPHHKPRPHLFFNQCEGNCLGPPPKVSTVAYSPIGMKSVVENLELICEPTRGNRILKIVVLNNHLQYNATCNGVLAGQEDNPGTIYNAIIKTKTNEEAVFPLKASHYRYVAHYNMASESFVENALLKNPICEGGELSSYSVWVADDPTQGCCSSGVKTTRAVYYKLEIRGGNCCTVCTLLSANDIYDSPLQN